MRLWRALNIIICMVVAAMGHCEPSDALIDSIHYGHNLLDEVVVTATRTPKTLLNVPVQTRLITKADILRADATDIKDLLENQLPGVEFTYAMNQQTNMNLSGFAGQSVLILVDGERLAGETMDNVDFARLQMAGIARIEIVKGAASALYGSNAAGGVINIITSEADHKWRANANVRGGRHGEWRTGIDVAAKGRHVSNTLQAGYYKIDSYNVCRQLSDDCDFRTVYGYRTIDIKDKFTYQPIDNLSLTARAGYYFKERYYNVDTPDRYRDFSGGLRGRAIFGSTNLDVAYAFDQYDKSDLIKATRKDIRDYRNVTHTLRAIANHDFDNGWLLTGGGDLGYDYLDTYQFKQGEDRHQYTADLFAQADWTIDRHWELIAALRYDYFSDTHDSRLTSKVNARYRLGDLTLRGGYAQGFRAPSLKEKYMNFDMVGIFDIHGNPSLKPETSNNFTLSAEYSYRNYNFTLGGSYSMVADKISTSAVRYGIDGKPYIDYINIRHLRVAGIEATARANWSNGLDAVVSYAYTHEQSLGGGITQYCPARPHSLNVNLSWSRDWSSRKSWLNTSTIALSGRVFSSVSYDTMYMYEPFEHRRISNPAYTMWRLSLSQTIFKGAQINLTVDNLLNYRPKVYSLNTPVTDGINLLVGVSLDIDKFFNK